MHKSAVEASHSRASTDKKQEIFAQAVRIFKQKGYHATSVQDIADAVGLQKGSLYHHISSKEGLLFEIFERGSTALTARLEEIIQADKTPTDKLRRAVEAHLVELCSHLDIFTVYLSERRALDGRHHAKMRAEGERQAQLLEQIIREGISTGDFRPVDCKLAARAVLGMCNWLYQWYSPEGRLRPDEIAAFFADLIISGLAAPA